VSLAKEDVALLDRYAKVFGSRSAVLHHALTLLNAATLQSEYAAAFEEWDQSLDRALWDSVTGDGLDSRQ